MTRTALYRHFDADGVLLYVGITDCLSQRDRQHAASSGWHAKVVRTETQWCLSREHAADLERVAVKHEKPLHNVQLSELPRPVVSITPQAMLKAAHGDGAAKAIRDMEDQLKAAGLSVDDLCQTAPIKRSTWTRWKSQATTQNMETWTRVVEAYDRLTIAKAS